MNETEQTPREKAEAQVLDLQKRIAAIALKLSVGFRDDGKGKSLTKDQQQLLRLHHVQRMNQLQEELRGLKYDLRHKPEMRHGRSGTKALRNARRAEFRRALCIIAGLEVDADGKTDGSAVSIAKAAMSFMPSQETAP